MRVNKYFLKLRGIWEPILLLIRAYLSEDWVELSSLGHQIAGLCIKIHCFSSYVVCSGAIKGCGLHGALSGQILDPFWRGVNPDPVGFSWFTFLSFGIPCKHPSPLQC